MFCPCRLQVLSERARGSPRVQERIQKIQSWAAMNLDVISSTEAIGDGTKFWINDLGNESVMQEAGQGTPVGQVQ